MGEEDFGQFFEAMRYAKEKERIDAWAHESTEKARQFERRRAGASLTQAAIADVLNKFKTDKRLAVFDVLSREEPPPFPESLDQPSKVSYRYSNMVLTFEALSEVDEDGTGHVILTATARRWDMLETRDKPYDVKVSVEGAMPAYRVEVCGLYETLLNVTRGFIEKEA